jgi:hypothetical protein
MSTTLLNEYQRIRLRDLSQVRKDKMYTAKPNVALEKYIEELHNQSPECFHTDYKSLSERVFFDEPTSVTPYARFSRNRNYSPYRIIPT